MNKVLSACGLESRTRWIELGAFNGHPYRHMCSNCGEITYKRILPKVCPNCKEKMLISQL